MDGSDGGEEGEGVAGEEEEGVEADEGDGVVTGFLPYMAGLEAGGGEAGDGLEVVDSGFDGVG